MEVQKLWKYRRYILDYEYLPDDIIEITNYNNHNFENYYYSPHFNTVIFDTGKNFYELFIHLNKCSEYVKAKDINGQKVNINIQKIRKQFGIKDDEN